MNRYQETKSYFLGFSLSFSFYLVCTLTLELLYTYILQQPGVYPFPHLENRLYKSILIFFSNEPKERWTRKGTDWEKKEFTAFHNGDDEWLPNWLCSNVPKLNYNQYKLPFFCWLLCLVHRSSFITTDQQKYFCRKNLWSTKLTLPFAIMFINVIMFR